MSALQRSWLPRYGSAAGAVAAAALLRWLLDSFLMNRFPFVTFLVAVVFTAWHAGFGPSLLAIVLGCLSAAYFFIEPRGSLAIGNGQDQIGMGLFLFVGMTCALFSEALGRARRRAETNAREAIDRQRELEREIAARVEAQEDLRRREAEYRRIVDTANEGVWVIDSGNRTTFVNRRMAEMLGCAPEDMLGRPAFDFVFPEDEPSGREFVERRKQGVSEHLEFRFRRKDGSELWTLVGASPIIEDGRFVGALGMFTDVTDRRRAVEQLREQTRRAETLNRVGAALAPELDLEKVVQLVTDEATALTGAQFGAFFYNVRDERGEAYTLYTISGVPREAFAQFPMPRNTAIFNPTFKGEGVVRLDDVTLDPRYGQNPPHHGMPAGHLPVKSYLAVSVVARTGEVLGGLFFGHSSAGVFTEQHERLATAIAAQAAIAIDNARLFGQAQESEQRFHQIAENVADTFWIYDPAAERTVYVSPAFERIWQRPRESIFDKPGAFADTLHPEDRERFAGHFERLRRGEPGVIEYRVLRPDGSPRWVRDRGFPVRDKQGRLARLAGVAEDFTERKLALEAVRENEERLRLAQEAGRLGTWEWNIATNHVTWSPALEAIHGLAPGTFPGTFEAYQRDMHPDDRGRVLASIEASVRDGTEHHLEYRLVWPDGSVHWIEARGKLFKDETGRPVRMIGVCLDVDRRKRTEQAFRFLADASATLSTLVDFESTLQKVARLAVPYFADWCAVDMADGEGGLRRVAVAHVDPAKVRFAHELEKKYPPDPSAAGGAHEVLRTGQSAWMAEIPAELLEGSARDEEHRRIIRELGLKSYMCVPLKVRGKTLGVITFVAAESGRSYDEADLGFAEELARRAAIAIENAQLYAQLRQADRRKDDFLAVLAHELRNPLAPIRNAVGVMALRGVEDPQVRWSRDVIERQVGQMTRLVDDLLDVSRINRGKVELRPEPAELAEIVSRAVETVRSFIDEHRHELIVTLPAEPLPLMADPTRLEQVLANLLNNAAKYTPDGGRIELSAAREGGEAVVRVKDTGIGIEPGFLPQLFEMFAQAEPGRKRSEGGLGIGLSLVKTLVERHGGSVAAESAGPGKGSTFTVRLPLRGEDRGTGTAGSVDGLDASRTTGRSARTTRRILVVDDNTDAADSLGMVLQLEGHRVEVAHDGPAAIQTFRREPAEVVFLDIGMPGMNGHEVARVIRRLPGGREALLVAVTGWGQEEDRRQSREAGFDHHLTKPVEIRAIHELLTMYTRPAGA